MENLSGFEDSAKEHFTDKKFKSKRLKKGPRSKVGEFIIVFENKEKIEKHSFNTNDFPSYFLYEMGPNYKLEVRKSKSMEDKSKVASQIFIFRKEQVPTFLIDEKRSNDSHRIVSIALGSSKAIVTKLNKVINDDDYKKLLEVSEANQAHNACEIKTEKWKMFLNKDLPLVNGQRPRASIFCVGLVECRPAITINGKQTPSGEFLAFCIGNNNQCPDTLDCIKQSNPEASALLKLYNLEAASF